MFIVMYQPILDFQHQAFAMNTIRRTNLLSNVEVVTLSTFCTNFPVFVHFALQSSRMKLYFWYLSCTHFPEMTHQYIFLLSPFFTWNISKHLLYFVLWKVDMGRNLWHSLVLQLQISNFSYSLKNLSPVWNYFRWRILHFHETRHRKRIIFVFCYSFNVLLFKKTK